MRYKKYYILIIALIADAISIIYLPYPSVFTQIILVGAGFITGIVIIPIYHDIH